MSRNKKYFSFFLWHRRLGLTAFILLMILSITGIMLNHTDSLKLDKTVINSDLILDWYNLNPTGNPISFTTNNHWISQWNQQIFLNGNSIFTHAEKLHGAIQIEGMIAIALDKNILLIDADGELIEFMNINTLDSIKYIGLTNNRISLLDEKNNFYLSDKNLSVWKPHKKTNTTWSKPKAVKHTELTQLKQSFRGEGLNLERLILDLHSGRLLNQKWGIYLMDASAIILILLGLSGIWVWWSRSLKMQRKKHYQKHHR